MKKALLVWTLGPALLAVAGCWDDGANTGKLSMAVTDAPVDGATAVVVQFTGVEVKPADGSAEMFTFEAPRQIDLLALTGTDSELLLDQVEVPAGRYNWVRLAVDANEDGVTDSYIDLEDGSRHELEVPSGAETGLKLNTGFVVPAGGAASFTLDFDLRKSVHEPMDAGDSFKLRPVLRIVDNARVGAIAGTVDAALVVEGCAPAVYVFTGSGVTPDDVDGAAPEPVSSAMPELNVDTGNYDYTIGFLAEGAYTATFTCDADDDNPETDDTLAFSGTQDATVVADQTTTVDFAPAP
ncbi:MAG: DUF4382 domain-containing protein [Nevskiaceae bacterium]